MTQDYLVLGIPQTATKEEIKKAYRRLSMIYHPDRPTGNKDKFMHIKQAYESLTKPDTTRVHDQYEHRSTPFVHINHAHLMSSGNVVIDVSFNNIAMIMGMDKCDYVQVTLGYNHGNLVVPKSTLIRCGYKFTLCFLPPIGRDIKKEFVFTDTRSKWEKFMDKLKSFI